MEPSLTSGRWILCASMGTHPTRGSIVVFPHPRRREMWLVKRIIGLPGEEVSADFGQVLIDGDPGLDLWSFGQATFPEGTWNPGPGEVLVLSDNRSATMDDGRSFGPVAMQDMLKVVWPAPRQAAQ